MCTLYTCREIKLITQLFQHTNLKIISKFQVKNSPQNQQLYRKTTHNSLKVHFITTNSLIQVFKVQSVPNTNDNAFDKLERLL